MRIRKIGAVILAAGVLIQSAKSGAELTESKQELIREMLAFYRTPVGRKSIEVMPSLVQDGGAGRRRGGAAPCGRPHPGDCR